MPRIEEVEQRNLNTGDQIAVIAFHDLDPLLLLLNMNTNITFYHHGIYDKETDSVIEFHGDTKANATPKRREFTEFVAGQNKLFRVVYDEDETRLPVDETMRMAENAVAMQNSWPSYDLIKNNCETFATYLKTGKPCSMQVFDAAKKLGAAALEVAGISELPTDFLDHLETI